MCPFIARNDNKRLFCQRSKMNEVHPFIPFQNININE